MVIKFIMNKQPPLSKTQKTIKKMLTSKDIVVKKELSTWELKLLNKIKTETDLFNKNNITRTLSYLDFYIRHPEIHWAFLAHMVSRNAGWSMTDLKGGFLSKLLTNKEAQAFFNFLERGNWLIFQDAYPQLLVYEESKRQRTNLFYLLPHLHISYFMETIWNYFWREPDKRLLTFALIINEQNYIETRVVQNPVFQKNVLNTLEFTLQDALSLNHILFPYKENERIQVVGQTVHHFESLQKRISLGKRLYSILFDDLDRLYLIEKWTKEHPHSGSRMDYWPYIFHYVNEGIPGIQLIPNIKSCSIPLGSPRIYSPKLEFSWKDQPQDPAEDGDWYRNWKVIHHLSPLKEHVNGEIKNDYCKTLEKLELAAITKKVLSPFY
ncbi:DUF2515 domain-containing protein [Niallia sp. XMNu-256]|uniref:DUF2515 domain-containing protein n=1 Tax=Niallia sp. XMNu-256 TaxID=3082444 RepID=UPI0030D5295B